MQPLKLVKPVKQTNWGVRHVMAQRPDLAIKIAQCIASWTEIETLLGMFLALLLHANEKAVLAMYAGVENRASQLRMLTATIDSTLAEHHADALNALVNAFIRPAMKSRDKLAHWCWGLTEELPDALLIRDPGHHLDALSIAIRGQGQRGEIAVPSNHETIFVIRKSDLDKTLKELDAVEFTLRLGMSTVWVSNSETERAAHLQQLSNEPRIQAGIAKLQKGRQKTPDTRSPSPPSELNRTP